MSFRPLISVCMPVYNAGPYLTEAINGVLAQTYDNYELIICDNCSTDDSSVIAQVLAATSPRVRFVQNQWNIGFSGNLHKVTSLAQGDFLLVHAADDVALPQALERYVETIQEVDGDPGNLVVMSDVFLVSQKGERQSILTADPQSPQHLHLPLEGDGVVRPAIQIYRGNEILSQHLATLTTFGWLGSILFSRRLYARVEGYVNNQWINPDKHFGYKILSLDPDVIWLHEPLFHFRQHDTNQNSQQRASGVLKFPLDEYAYTIDFSSDFFKKYGPGKDAVVQRFIDSDCLETALREMAVGSRQLGFRHLCFALATYPSVAWRNKKTYWALLTWLTGPVGGLLARSMYRSNVWRRWWRR